MHQCEAALNALCTWQERTASAVVADVSVGKTHGTAPVYMLRPSADVARQMAFTVCRRDGHQLDVQRDHKLGVDSTWDDAFSPLRRSGTEAQWEWHSVLQRRILAVRLLVELGSAYAGATERGRIALSRSFATLDLMRTFMCLSAAAGKLACLGLSDAHSFARKGRTKLPTSMGPSRC